jgi:dual specificity tyrosine-phosphorylation-regulated kinase 2/3/4
LSLLHQPQLHLEPALDDLDSYLPRSSSASSSLDPYYFGLQSPSVSPAPPLPSLPDDPTSTPDLSPLIDPITPAKNPASIDRRALVGVGELTTPRWAHHERYDDQDSFEAITSGGADVDGSVSPWTIEAVDGELSEQEEVSLFCDPEKKKKLIVYLAK